MIKNYILDILNNNKYQYDLEIIKNHVYLYQNFYEKYLKNDFEKIFFAKEMKLNDFINVVVIRN